MENQIVKIEVYGGNLTFWLAGSDEPWDSSEFEKGSDTRNRMERIEELVLGLDCVVCGPRV